MILTFFFQAHHENLELINTNLFLGYWSYIYFLETVIKGEYNHKSNNLIPRMYN